jgi:predicted ATPase
VSVRSTVPVHRAVSSIDGSGRGERLCAVRRLARSPSMKCFVSTVTVTEKWRGFPKGAAIELRPGLNVLVGDQGSGKSSVLRALEERAAGKGRRHPVQLTFGPDASKDVTVVGFDFEKSNPRTLSHFLDGDAMGAQVAAMFSSHGEAVNAILADARRRCLAQPTLLVLDEPDMALSPRSAHRLAAMFAELADAGAQVVVSVHNPIVIAAAGEVLSVEKRKWVSADSYLRAAERAARRDLAARSTPEERPSRNAAAKKAAAPKGAGAAPAS